MVVAIDQAATSLFAEKICRNTLPEPTKALTLQTGGRPSEHNLRRVDRSDFRFPAIVYASNVKVLR